jgi:integrase
MKLNDKICKNAKAHKKAYKLSDGGGLYLEVTPKGSKLWRMKYRFLNKEKKLSIGEYPAISLADARSHREKAKKQLAGGLDPSSVKQGIKQGRIQEAANTFEAIAREWHERKAPEWSKVNAKIVIDRLERDVFPEIGKYPIKTITHKMILDLANGIKERGANELAKRVVQMCRHIYQYAIVTGRADKNIAEDLRGLVKSEPKSHYAAIEAKDLPKFIKDLRNQEPLLNRQTYLAVELMMLTFVRTGEMIKAEWSEFDLKEKIWLIPAHRMKMKKEHIVPLSKQAVSIIEELRELHSHPVYVFPNRNKRDKHMSNNTILMALDRMGYPCQLRRATWSF